MMTLRLLTILSCCSLHLKAVDIESRRINPVRSRTELHPACTAEFHQIWCVGAELTQIPAIEIHPDNTTRYLDLSKNKIQGISWELEMYPFLEYLNLANNSLSLISVSAFVDSHALQELNLSGNKLTSNILNEELFRPLSNLQSLLISSNFLGPRLNISIFRSLTKLTLLDLDYNNIVFISGPVVSDAFLLSNLSELKLRGNFLLQIPREIWILMPNLIQLDLSENAFPVIANASFTGLLNLKSLLLKNNHHLRHINAYGLAYLPRIQHIELCGCKNLNSINHKAFYNVSSITSIHLENNNLTTLGEDLLPWQHVRLAFFSGNNWHCDCALRWVYNLVTSNRLADKRITYCKSPGSVRGRSVDQLRENDYHCSPQRHHMTDIEMLHMWEIIVVIVSSVIATTITVIVGIKIFNRISASRPDIFGAQMSYGTLYESYEG